MKKNVYRSKKIDLGPRFFFTKHTTINSYFVFLQIKKKWWNSGNKVLISPEIGHYEKNSYLLNRKKWNFEKNRFGTEESESKKYSNCFQKKKKRFDNHEKKLFLHHCFIHVICLQIFFSFFSLLLYNQFLNTHTHTFLLYIFCLRLKPLAWQY